MPVKRKVQVEKKTVDFLTFYKEEKSTRKKKKKKKKMEFLILKINVERKRNKKT